MRGPEDQSIGETFKQFSLLESAKDLQLCSLICLSDIQIAHFSRISKLLKSIYIVKVMEPIEMNLQIKREKAAWKILRERQSKNNLL